MNCNWYYCRECGVFSRLRCLDPKRGRLRLIRKCPCAMKFRWWQLVSFVFLQVVQTERLVGTVKVRSVRRTDSRSDTGHPLGMMTFPKINVPERNRTIDQTSSNPGSEVCSRNSIDMGPNGTVDHKWGSTPKSLPINLRSPPRITVYPSRRRNRSRSHTRRHQAHPWWLDVRPFRTVQSVREP